MTVFSGWSHRTMGAGGVKGHLHVRRHAGLFDVSHMTPVRISASRTTRSDALVDFWSCYGGGRAGPPGGHGRSDRAPAR